MEKIVKYTSGAEEGESVEVNYSPEIKFTKLKLVSEDRPEFVKQFIETTEGLTKEEIAILVWNFANERWSSGYNRGKYDPDFENYIYISKLKKEIKMFVYLFYATKEKTLVRVNTQYPEEAEEFLTKNGCIPVGYAKGYDISFKGGMTYTEFKRKRKEEKGN